jgi:hypothetical protein
MPRILVCYAHKTIDILPDYNTAADMAGENDWHLRDAIKGHTDKYGAENPPGQKARHPSKIFRITEDEWDLIDPEQLKNAMLNDELEEYLKGEREHYKDGAVNCFYLHGKPILGFPGCPDYRSSSKAIGRTKGIPDEEKMYLCDFCPYHSYVVHEQRKKAGLYD